MAISPPPVTPQVRDVPPSLYKYCPPARRSLLEDLLISFSTLAQFNDPLEGLTQSTSLFPATGKGSLADRAAGRDFRREAFRQVYSRATSAGATAEQAVAFAKTISENDSIVAWIRNQVPLAAEALLADSRLSYLSFEREIAKSLGVLSLSETSVSPPMWAHYAASYSGFVIEFDGQHSFFNGPLAVKPVRYTLRKHDHFMQMDESDLLLRKASDWQYEKEWRLMRLLEDADQVTASGHHLFRLPASAIKGLILGELVDDEIEQEALRQSRLRQWKVSRVVADKKSKALRIEAIT